MKILWFVPLFLLVAGCGSANHSMASVTRPVGDPPVVAPTPTPLSQTIFMGDSIIQEWPYVTGNTVVITNGKMADFVQAFSEQCDKGCTPSALQTAAAGKKQIVILIGTYDALSMCAGGAQSDLDLDTLVRAMSTLFKLKVLVGTIPNLYDSKGNIQCAEAVSTVNAQIRSVAATEGLTVVDFNQALAASSDYDLTTDPYGLYLPNVAGYGLMEDTYTAANQ